MRSTSNGFLRLLLLGASPLIACAATHATPGASPPERRFVVGPDLQDLDMRMETVVVDSKPLGSRVQVDVSWIPGTEKTAGLPVVYLTDGHWRRVDHKYVHYLAARGVIPPVIVAGIGYPEGTDVQRARTKDLVDAPDPFLQAILAEVIPWVERRFPCDPKQRVLFGSSMGGYFSLYTLRRSALAGERWFFGYVASSTYRADAALSIRELRARKVPARLYLTYGGLERRSGFDVIARPNTQLFHALDSAGVPELEYVHHVYPDADHYTTTRPTLVDGLRLILGTGEARGIGFTDLSLESVRYDFRAAGQVYDWEAAGALRAIAPADDGAPRLDAMSGSLRVAADFAVGSGRLSTTFDHFEDLAGNELVFHVFVPESLAKLGYEARSLLYSTYQWKEDVGDRVRIDQAGWNRLAFRLAGEGRRGDPALARAVGVVIERPEGAPAWKGELYLDGISW
ncbi:MAG TPA: alpha/beta hydrolase-fold protein [Anaeromyxobacter sp.]|nr:alpha/beta hydrolase-fold protein [Anaeromyxobacter sp.]